MNKSSREHYRKNIPVMNQAQEKVLRELNQDGISSLPFRDLFPEVDFSLFLENMNQAMSDTSNQMRIREQERGESAASKKYYLVELWKKPFLFDPQNSFMRFGIHERILGIVNQYLEMSSHLSYMNLWYTVPMTKAANYSQRWHRDPDDRKLVKLFLYLTDVDQGAGPFYYIPGSHGQGPYGKVLPSKPPYSTYPQEGKVEKFFSKEQIRTCTGPAGTLIFCDTKGLHKGGHATENPRILFNAVYLTEGAIPAEKRKVNFYVPKDFNREYALSWSKQSDDQ
ncbi:MAG: hypothetical protein EXS63_09135 [Candidatus Omnitrophica bacterium]|nr:hypothetical protein [Candidatus Omnitrophota bacterium]